jgi:cytochrome c oxidase cbb3-type subunit I/II
VLILIGGIVEMVPTFVVSSNVPTIESVKPYTPLELEGRDLYIREGCNACHSQMVRPLRFETERYGEYSKGGEFVYDHPFLWGSKRTGPDLAREGQINSSAQWHYVHMLDPEKLSSGSIMPAYPHLLEDKLDTTYTKKKIRAMRTLGVPYPKGYDKVAVRDLLYQAREIQAELAESGIETPEDMEIIALIAYLTRLGTDIQVDASSTQNNP